MLSRHLQRVAGTVLAASVATGTMQAIAQDVRWDMQTDFPGSFAPYGSSGIRFVERVKEMSGGRFDIRFHEPGALVDDAIEAVASGEIEASWTYSGFHGEDFGFASTFFGSAPFGPGPGEFRAWMMHGGGQILREELYNAHGITAVSSFCVGPESSGWFKTEIASLQQLRGLKMRVAGLPARVWQKMGVSTVSLRGGDILPALERGDIDAADFAMPYVDINFGFHRVAKYNYYPGWHQAFTCGELLMNKAVYDALPDAYKTIIRAAATLQGFAAYEESEAENPVALAKLRDDHGVNILRWSDEALRRFEAAWNEVVAEESAADPRFKKVADSYFAFRRAYRIWGDAQALKRTYQDGSSRTLPVFLSADDPKGRQGFVRIINRSDQAGTVSVVAVDDTGERFGPVSLSLAANQTRHFNSGDLEDGNSTKGLSGGVGSDGSGNWRLELDTELDIKPLAYIRTDDGFLTSIHEVSVESGEGSMRYDVPFFNPGKNTNQVSMLRLINPGGESASIVIRGLDDRGDPPPGTDVSLTLDAGAAVTLTAQQIEQGGDDFNGSFGEGKDKWQLTVSADRPIEVMSLLQSPTGHLTNLSQ